VKFTPIITNDRRERRNQQHDDKEHVHHVTHHDPASHDEGCVGKMVILRNADKNIEQKQQDGRHEVDDAIHEERETP
jgi:hypothetical protein